MEVGYARVSTTGQSLEVQMDKLKNCEKIFSEKASATNPKRLELDRCLEFVREGDTLVVTKIDRLARSTLHLCQILAQLKAKNVDFKVLDQNIETQSPTGKLLFNVLGAIAEFETQIRAERQSEGISKARENGIKFGAEKKLDDKMVKQLRERRNQNIKIKQLMEEFKISKATVYRCLAETTQ